MKLKLNPKKLATVLFNLSDKNDILLQINNALKELNDIAADSGQFRMLIQSKKINGKTKVEILNKILGNSGHPLVNEIISYLSGSNALDDLRNISIQYQALYNKGKSFLEVKGKVPHQMTDSQIQSLENSIEEVLGKKISLSIEVDSNLIGGIKLRIDNTFLDASIQNQLQMLRKELLQI